MSIVDIRYYSNSENKWWCWWFHTHYIFLEDSPSYFNVSRECFIEEQNNDETRFKFLFNILIKLYFKYKYECQVTVWSNCYNVSYNHFRQWSYPVLSIFNLLYQHMFTLPELINNTCCTSLIIRNVNKSCFKQECS